MIDTWKNPWLQAQYPSEECGCPVEEWIYKGIMLTLHCDTDEETVSAWADAGDWDHEVDLVSTNLRDGREEIFAWVRTLPTEEEFAQRAATG